MINSCLQSHPIWRWAKTHIIQIMIKNFITQIIQFDFVQKQMSIVRKMNCLFLGTDVDGLSVSSIASANCYK